MAIVTWATIMEAKPIFFRHLRVRGKYFAKYKGNANQISSQILNNLWNGRYLQTSTCHYHFYSRDFAMMLPSLLFLGKRKQAKATLYYALQQYEKHGAITTLITRKHTPTNFPNVYSPDSVAYFFYSLRLLNDTFLIKKYYSFLQKEVNKFFKTVVDTTTHLPKRKTHFGDMRDHAKRDASCYDMTMLALLVREAKALGFTVPYKQDPVKLLIVHYWTGRYFRDDLSSKQLTADANIYPFWLGLISNKKLLKIMIDSLQKEGLDKPFPVKYVNEKAEKGKTLFIEKIFAPNWQGDAIWPMSGLPYIQTLARVDMDQAKFHLKQYESLIEKYKTFLEVYTAKGEPYKSLFYSSEESMVWCALYLHLAKTL